MKYNQWMFIILAGLLFTLNACDKSEESKTNTSSVSSKSTSKGVVSEEAYILNKKVEKVQQEAEKKADLFSDTAVESSSEYEQKLKTLGDAINDEAEGEMAPD